MKGKGVLGARPLTFDSSPVGEEIYNEEKKSRGNDKQNKYG